MIHEVLRIKLPSCFNMTCLPGLLLLKVCVRITLKVGLRGEEVERFGSCRWRWQDPARTILWFQHLWLKEDYSMSIPVTVGTFASVKASGLTGTVLSPQKLSCHHALFRDRPFGKSLIPLMSPRQLRHGIACKNVHKAGSRAWPAISEPVPDGCTEEAECGTSIPLLVWEHCSFLRRIHCDGVMGGQDALPLACKPSNRWL